MNEIRPAKVAGAFYPGRPERLRATINEMLDAVTVPEDDELARAYVVPHAGYRFSGPIAATVYARLRAHAEQVKRVLLLGPSHFVPLEGMAASPATAWRTPLGTVTLGEAPGIPVAAEPHDREHSLEVQFPFLQVCLPNVPITPVAVGRSTIEETARLIGDLVTDDTLLLCSTDLSHYHDEMTARKLDRATADAILAGEPRRIGNGDACGIFALRGTVAWAGHQGLTACELDLRTSADTFGGPDRVVGYPAFSFKEP